MQAERIFLETNSFGKLQNLPNLPVNKKIEAIFLVVDDLVPQAGKRVPHPDIAGKMKITGDLFDTVPADGWNFSQ